MQPTDLTPAEIEEMRATAKIPSSVARMTDEWLTEVHSRFSTWRVEDGCRCRQCLGVQLLAELDALRAENAELRKDRNAYMEALVLIATTDHGRWGNLAEARLRGTPFHDAARKQS